MKLLITNRKKNINFRKLTEHLNHYLNEQSAYQNLRSNFNSYSQAAKFFQNHDFKKSLQLYDQCINICKKNQ